MDMNLLIPEFFFFKRHILASLHFNENLQRETQRVFDGKFKGMFRSLTQNLKWERKLCERWHAHLLMIRINMTSVD